MHDFQSQIVKRNAGIRSLEILVGRNHPVMQDQCGLDHAGNSGTGFEVTDVGFDRADQALFVLGPTFPENSTQGF